MTRRVDPDFGFPEPDKPGVNWRKWIAVGLIVVLIAMGAFFLYKNI